MEYIPIIIGLFFVLSWTYGVFVVGGAYATGTNMFTVIWWWISFVVIFLTGLSFWHLFWMMPLVPFLCLYGGVSGILPIVLLLIYKYLIVA